MRVVVLLDCVGDIAAHLREMHGDELKVDIYPDATERSTEEIHGFISGANGIITSLRTSVNAEFLDAAGPQLQVVSNYAVGYDNIDLKAAEKRNVAVCYAPPPVREPTADIAWLLLLAAARRAHEGHTLARSGSWVGYEPGLLLGKRIIGANLLVVGAGRIGSAIARRSLGWDMNVMYVANSDKPKLESAPLNASRVELQEGLSKADFIVVSVSLNSDTIGLIGQKEFTAMKSDAVFVNVSRGTVVDESALVNALKHEEIFAAGLDVFEKEPEIHPELLNMERAFLLPHLGSATLEDRLDLTKLAAENAIAVLCGNSAPFQVAAEAN